MSPVPTDQLYLRDAYQQQFEATVIAVDTEGRRASVEQGRA
jgi:hypothetical protein